MRQNLLFPDIDLAQDPSRRPRPSRDYPSESEMMSVLREREGKGASAQQISQKDTAKPAKKNSLSPANIGEKDKESVEKTGKKGVSTDSRNDAVLPGNEARTGGTRAEKEIASDEVDEREGGTSEGKSWPPSLLQGPSPLDRVGDSVESQTEQTSDTHTRNTCGEEQ